MVARIDQRVLEDLLTGPNGPVVRYIERICRRTENEAKRLVDRDTGRGAASIDHVLIIRNGRVVGIVGSDLEYLAYRHRGTGIYGPHASRIRPVSAKALKFLPKRGSPSRGRPRRGAFVFAKSVAGAPANPFLVNALNTVLGRG